MSEVRILPVGQFTLDDPNALLALAVFTAVAGVVDRSPRLSRRHDPGAGGTHARDLRHGLLPAALAGPPLLERVIATLVGNTARHTPARRKALLTASAHADRERLFEPFRRLGDTDNTTGLGLGPALSRGLTMVLSLPFAERADLPGDTQSVGGGV
ncbi:hypothetical protein ACFV8Z_02445 [Streptomyces sp. NPDC059837]|uniref:hypothetical protein n=1 Tax=Streptomyces sp. NPDC059837 TaxID=3346968 RepID=UPI00365055F4